MPRTAARAWDRQEGETDDAYGRFLVYRNLGFVRRLDDAFEAILGRRTRRGRRQAYYALVLESARNRWYERAVAWDVSRIPEQLERIAVNIVALKAATAEKVALAAASGERVARAAGTTWIRRHRWPPERPARRTTPA
jgi:hypothetical protein